MKTSYQSFLDNVNQIAEKYNTTINPVLENNLSNIYNINKRYQLTPGTEKDFNNAVTFFYYSMLKNSKKIDSAENDFSNIFKNILLSYYEKNINNSELITLLNYIYSYNKAIKDKFDLQNTDITKKKESIQNVFSDIYFLNPETLELSENSYAYMLLQNIQKIYETYMDPDNNLNVYIYSVIEIQFLLIALFSTLYCETIKNDDELNVVENINQEDYKIALIANADNPYYTELEKLSNDTDPLSVSGASYYYSLQINNPLYEDKYLNIFLSETHDIILDTKAIVNSTIFANNGNNSPLSLTIQDENNNAQYYVYYIEDDNSRKRSFYINYNNQELVIGEPAEIVLGNNTSIHGIKLYLNTIFENVIQNKSKFSIVASYNNGSINDTQTFTFDINNKNLNKLPIIYENDTTLKNIGNVNDIYNIINSLVENINTQNPNDNLFNITGMNSLYDTETIIEFYKYFYKINVEFINSSASIETNEDLSKLYKSEKRSYGSTEAYYLDNWSNLNIFSFGNIVLHEGTDLYNAWNELYKLETGSQTDLINSNSGATNLDNYAVCSLNVVYKELNEEIRKIDNSYIQNKIIAKYLIETGDYSFATTEGKLGLSLFENIYNATPNFILSQNEIDIFNSLKTNSYVIRHGRESDLIAYLMGDIIDYGNTSDTKKEIETILKLYTETRDYYYRVLLNKAFILDDLYPIYEKLFIIAYTIERFISSKIDYVLDIDHFNDTDCKNFLESFGLEILNKQIANNNFADSLEYKKRIIADYNDLMSQKGSKAIIDEFFKIFNYGENEITIYKYLILNTNNNDVTEPVFLRIPYDATNVAYYIRSSMANAVAYDTFIKDDIYWSSEDLPKEEVSKILTSPQNTKYIGIDLTSNLYNNFISTRYAIATNQYIYASGMNTLTAEFNSDLNADNIYSDLLISGVVINNSEYQLSIITLYSYIRELFKYYVAVNEEIYKTAVISSDTDQTQSKPHYYGINNDVSFDINNNDDEIIKNISNKLNVSFDLIKNVFDTIYGIVPTNSNLNNSIIFPTSTNIIHNTFFTKSGVTNYNIYPSILKNDIGNNVQIYFSSNFKKSSNEALVLYDSGNDNSNLEENPYYKELIEISYELLYGTSINSSANGQTYRTALESAFLSISLINLLNKLKKAKTENNSEEIVNCQKMIRAAYRLYKNGNNSEYSINSNIAAEDEISLANSNFYSFIYSIILDFPNKYLHDEFQNNKGINYNKQIHDTLEYIFNTFFIVETDPIGRLELSDVNNIINNIIINANSNDPSATETAEQQSIRTSITNELNDINILNTNEEKSEKIQQLIINYASVLNSALDALTDMKVNFSISLDTNNFFNFIKTSIEFFISYTANLYTSNLIYEYNDTTEHVPLAYSFEDSIENKLYDYFYYDYDVTITEYDE